MPVPLDSASVAALVESLRLRSDDLDFAIHLRTPTRYRFGYSRNVPESAAKALAPVDQEPRAVLTYRTRYRMHRMSGFLVCGLPQSVQATGLLALAAKAEMDAYEMRYPKPSPEIPTKAPYGNAVTASPSDAPESLLIAMQFGWSP